jgi:hypothetical protein
MGGCLLGARNCPADDIDAASADLREPITMAADACSHWQEGDYEVWHLRGNCYIHQGMTYARAPEAVLWIANSSTGAEPTKVIAYLEEASGQKVVVDYCRPDVGRQGGNAVGTSMSRPMLGRQITGSWLGRLYSSVPMRTQLPPAAVLADARPAIYARGLEQFDPERRRQLLLAQFTQFAPLTEASQPLPPGMRRMTTFPRSDSPSEIEWRSLANGENAAVISGGIRVLIEGLPSSNVPGALGLMGTIDISTDRAVIWASGIDATGSSQDSSAFQSHDAPLEIYMEGNIEFRQGDRIVYADRMFYDVRRQIGVILGAELLTPLPQSEDFRYQGLVRLRAGAIRQLDQSHFVATDALMTTSRLEKPSYHMGSGQITFEDLQRPVLDPLTGQPQFDPRTGEPMVHHQQMATSRGNKVYVRGIPVFYWPTLATDLEKPSFFINNAKVGSDSIFGTQLIADWDAYQLFGIQNAPAGTEWNLSTDYLSKRGFGWGTSFEYEQAHFLGMDSPATGLIDFWAIKDTGFDNLGASRRRIQPEEDFRFRLYGQHRQRFRNGWELTTESGWISDRTFLEEYFEREWDQFKSPRTGARLKRLIDNRALSVEMNGQVNDFFTTTQWLPRADHYWLGQSILGDRLTWFEHSQAAYANQNVASTPTEPVLEDQFRLMPWEQTFDGSGVRISGKGERLVTRQELDLPFSLGPVKVVPFALGELAHWGEVRDGGDLQRAYVHTGVRASVPFWAVFSKAHSNLMNIDGLAHKVVFDTEFSYADANRNLDQLALYDPLDDTSITEYRRRLLSPVLPTVMGPKFDPRSWAFRSGMQGWVTSPTTEIVDDLMALRMGMRHRLQTKRGMPGERHIVDWLTADTNITWFPKAERDNFGQDIGLFNYDVRWHLGDRFTLLSDGAADFFSDGLKTISGGVLMNRPTRGNAYLGVRSISGPITSNAVLGNFNYRVSPKWLATASLSLDLSDTGNIGQSYSMTRIGESLLVTVGVYGNTGQDVVGVNFLVEPRFLPNLQLTRRTGIEVPPAGAFGLE